MLEDRLSSTYSHHNLGGYIAPPQARVSQSNIYPSLSSATANAPGGAESFYYGNAPTETYAPPQNSYNAYPQQPSAYPVHDQRPPSASVSYGQPQSPALPRQQFSANRSMSTSSSQGIQSSGVLQNNMQYPPQQPIQEYGQQPIGGTQVPLPFTPSEPPQMQSPSDLATAFYFDHQASTPAQGQMSDSRFPPQQQGIPVSDQYRQPSNVHPPQTPQQQPYPSRNEQPQSYPGQDFQQGQSSMTPQQHPTYPSQDYGVIAPNQVQIQPPQSPLQQTNNQPNHQTYWQPQQQQQPPQQQHISYNQTPKVQQPASVQYQGYPTYTQDSFPAAPQHQPQPQPQPVEESLIDL
jgi:hepatocyte growth factor-regulated tyrosine kinase substrate